MQISLRMIYSGIGTPHIQMVIPENTLHCNMVIEWLHSISGLLLQNLNFIAIIQSTSSFVKMSDSWKDIVAVKSVNGQHVHF